MTATDAWESPLGSQEHDKDATVPSEPGTVLAELADLADRVLQATRAGNRRELCEPAELLLSASAQFALRYRVFRSTRRQPQQFTVAMPGDPGAATDRQPDSAPGGLPRLGSLGPERSSW